MRKHRMFYSTGLLVMFLAGVASPAATLSGGDVVYRHEFGVRSAKGPYSGSTAVDIPNNGRRSVVSTAATLMIGMDRGWQTDLFIEWAKSFLTKGDFANRKAGETVTGINRLGFRFTKDVYQTHDMDLSAFVTVRSPGKSGNGNDFLSLNDNIVVVELGASHLMHFENFAIALSGMYLWQADVRDQIAFELQAPLYFFDGFAFGPIAKFLFSTSGIELTDPNFGHPTLGPQFANKKERFLDLGLFAQVPLSDDFSLDAQLSTRFAARNTDRGFTIGLAGNYSF